MAIKVFGRSRYTWSAAPKKHKNAFHFVLQVVFRTQDQDDNGRENEHGRLFVKNFKMSFESPILMFIQIVKLSNQRKDKLGADVVIWVEEK